MKRLLGCTLKPWQFTVLNHENIQKPLRTMKPWQFSPFSMFSSFVAVNTASARNGHCGKGKSAICTPLCEKPLVARAFSPYYYSFLVQARSFSFWLGQPHWYNTHHFAGSMGWLRGDYGVSSLWLRLGFANLRGEFAITSLWLRFLGCIFRGAFAPHNNFLLCTPR